MLEKCNRKSVHSAVWLRRLLLLYSKSWNLKPRPFSYKYWFWRIQSQICHFLLKLKGIIQLPVATIQMSNSFESPKSIKWPFNNQCNSIKMLCSRIITHGYWNRFWALNHPIKAFDQKRKIDQRLANPHNSNPPQWIVHSPCLSEKYFKAKIVITFFWLLATQHNTHQHEKWEFCILCNLKSVCRCYKGKMK